MNCFFNGAGSVVVSWVVFFFIVNPEKVEYRGGLCLHHVSCPNSQLLMSLPDGQKAGCSFCLPNLISRSLFLFFPYGRLQRCWRSRVVSLRRACLFCHYLYPRHCMCHAHLILFVSAPRPSVRTVILGLLVPLFMEIRSMYYVTQGFFLFFSF
jgi:hypothetical protein